MSRGKWWNNITFFNFSHFFLFFSIHLHNLPNYTMFSYLDSKFLSRNISDNCNIYRLLFHQTKIIKDHEHEGNKWMERRLRDDSDKSLMQCQIYKNLSVEKNSSHLWFVRRNMKVLTWYFCHSFFHHSIPCSSCSIILVIC